MIISFFYNGTFYIRTSAIRAQFNYIVKTKTGKSEAGIINASNLSEARKELLGKDLILLSLEPISKKIRKDFNVLFFSRISHLDKLLFIKHLAIMRMESAPKTPAWEQEGTLSFGGGFSNTQRKHAFPGE